MAANTLTLTKSYGDGLAWTESIMDRIKSDIESWALDTVDNLNQIRLDVFGSSYSYDNDGAANNTTAMNVGQTITPTATINAIDIAASALTTGKGIDITDADGLTTGTCIAVTSNSSSASTRYLVDILNDNTAATGAIPLRVTQDASAVATAIYNTANSNVLNIYAQNTSQTATVFNVDCSRAGNSAYLLMVASSGGGADTEFKVRGDGEVYGDGAAYNTPADYAEMFECVDRTGIEPGYFVTVADGLIRKATGKDKYILGVVSGNPAVVGDNAWDRWSQKYLKDEFNRYILSEDGSRVLNPKFNPKKVYVPRDDRPEWVPVGLLGKLNVRTSTDIKGDYVDIGDNGMAINGDTYRVLEVLRQKSNDPEKKGYGVVKIIFRGKE